MNQTEKLYNDYWTDKCGASQKHAYYDRLYSHIKSRIKVDSSDKVLDVAGGNGALLQYLGIQKADVLDISDSGLQEASQLGFKPIKGDIQSHFPVPSESYDKVFCFEVLEHLNHPNKTLAEINHVLKPGGVIYVAQPNMPPDDVYHVRRYAFKELIDDLAKSGFVIEWADFVPAYSVRAAILDDIKRNPRWIRKAIQCVNLTLSFLPWRWRYAMAKYLPNRFALLFVIKAMKESL